MVGSCCLPWSSCVPPLEISLPTPAPPCFPRHGAELVSLRAVWVASEATRVPEKETRALFRTAMREGMDVMDIGDALCQNQRTKQKGR